MNYKHLFFDLDRTLWDFESNADEALTELYESYQLSKRNIICVDFLQKYKMHNERLWELYRDSKIDKDNLRSLRFQLALEEFGIKDQTMAKEMGDEYIRSCPLKKHVFPFTYSILDYLYKKYTLHIITNGFEEVQYVKLKHSNLLHYFQQVITSEQVGVKKPNPKIFNYALFKASSKASESIMIGDDFPVDILGAKNFGIDQIYFNPNNNKYSGSITYEINCLSQLREIL